MTSAAAPKSDFDWQQLPVDLKLIINKFLTAQEIATSAATDKVFKQMMDNTILWKQLGAKWKFTLDPNNVKNDFIKKYYEAINNVILDLFKKIKISSDPVQQRKHIEDFLQNYSKVKDEEHIIFISQASSNPFTTLAQRVIDSPQSLQDKSALLLLMKCGLGQDFNLITKLFESDTAFFNAYIESIKTGSTGLSHAQAWLWAISKPDPSHMESLAKAGGLQKKFLPWLFFKSQLLTTQRAERG